MTVRVAVQPWALRILPDPWCRCPKCGAQQVKKRKRRDRIDTVSLAWASTIHRLLGGCLYHCRTCRLQFYDVRPQRIEFPTA